jgi:hypothetical protein
VESGVENGQFSDLRHLLEQTYPINLPGAATDAYPGVEILNLARLVELPAFITVDIHTDEVI